MAVLDPPHGAALTVDATRRSVRSYLLVAASVTTVAAALMVAGLMVFASHATGFDLQSDGASTPGVITSIATRTVQQTRILSVTAHVDFSIDGHRRNQRMVLDARAAQLRVGDHVTVVYDPTDPSHVGLRGTYTSHGVPPLVIFGFGAILGVIGWPGLRRARMVRRLTAANPWRAMPGELVELPLDVGRFQRSRTLLRLGRDLHGITAAPVGLRRLNPTFVPTVWVVGIGQREMVVAPPGGGSIVLVQRVKAGPEAGERPG